MTTNIIYKLTFRYMNKNKKRTRTTILGIAGTIMIITAVYLFSQALMGMIRNDIIGKEGSYHAIFHDLNKEQYEELKGNKKIAKVEITKCDETTTEETICVAVQMKKVNWKIYETTQKIAKQIGLRQISENEQYELPYRVMKEYDISYHMKLLEYYGIKQDDGFGVGVLIHLVLALLTLMGGVLIYNAYAISTFEKLKYLGTLGSVGASSVQKAGAVYWEGFLEGLLGIPTGIVGGIILSKGIMYELQKILMFDQDLTIVVELKTILGLTFLGFAMVCLACTVPAWNAIHASSMELVKHSDDISMVMRNRTNLLKPQKGIDVTTRLAFKNIWNRRRSYIANGVLVIITFCMILDGMAVMRGVNGEYYPIDNRERKELQLWTDLYTMDTDKINQFYQELSKQREITNLSLERNLDIGGILVKSEQIQSDLKEFEISSVTGFSRDEKISQVKKVFDVNSGKWVEGYYLRTVIVGLDDETFQEYVEKAGYEIPTDKNQPYPVLIEDYEEVKTAQGVSQRCVLNLEPGSKFTFQYSRYGDMESYTEGEIEGRLDEIRTGEFTLIGTTQEAPPYAYYSAMQDNITGYQERTLGICHMYLSMSDFEKLIESKEFCDTYGAHPEDTSAFNYEGYKSIASYIKFDIQRDKNNEETAILDRILKNKGLSARIQEDEKMEDSVDEIAGKVGLKKVTTASIDRNLADGLKLPENDSYAYNSASIWKKEQYFHSEQFLLLVLGYGIILLITILSLTNIFQNIATSMRLRRHEFAAYQSMGMSQATLKKMLFIESSMYGVIGCLVGIPCSFLGLYQVYDSFKHSYEIVWEIPWDMVPIQLVIAVFLMLLPPIYAMSQLKNLNIIESIRQDNI